MCLGIPARVVQIDESNMGKVEYLGTKVMTNFELLEDLKLGDWVIVHAGFAISKLNEEEARETFSILKEMAEMEAEADKDRKEKSQKKRKKK